MGTVYEKSCILCWARESHGGSGELRSQDQRGIWTIVSALYTNGFRQGKGQDAHMVGLVAMAQGDWKKETHGCMDDFQTCHVRHMPLFHDRVALRAPRVLGER